MYRTIIWDWNGTLLNDARACCRIINLVLAKRRLKPLPYARYMEIFDFPVRRYYEQLGFDFQRESFEVIGSEFIARYERQRHRLRLQSGAREILSALRQRGVNQIVLSAYRQDTLNSLLAEKKLARFFDFIAGADDHYARGKKDQGVELIKRLKLRRKHTLMIGDTLHDHEVAVAMGIDCVLLDAGHQSRRRLATSGAPVLPDLPALWKHMRRHLPE